MNVSYLSDILAQLKVAEEMCYELSDNFLTNKKTVEPVDKSIVLFEVINALQESERKLELMKYRISMEKGEEDGNAGENEGP